MRRPRSGQGVNVVLVPTGPSAPSSSSSSGGGGGGGGSPQARARARSHEPRGDGPTAPRRPASGPARGTTKRGLCGWVAFSVFPRRSLSSFHLGGPSNYSFRKSFSLSVLEHIIESKIWPQKSNGHAQQPLQLPSEYIALQMFGTSHSRDSQTQWFPKMHCGDGVLGGQAVDPPPQASPRVRGARRRHGVLRPLAPRPPTAVLTASFPLPPSPSRPALCSVSLPSAHLPCPPLSTSCLCSVWSGTPSGLACSPAGHWGRGVEGGGGGKPQTGRPF